MTAVFQPHLYTRTRDFAPEFAEALSLADKVILLDIYPARELPIPGVTSDIIFKDITAEKVLLKRSELMDYLMEEPVQITITLKEEDGYREQWLIRQLVRTNEQEISTDLWVKSRGCLKTDAADTEIYSRIVTRSCTCGMSCHILYRRDRGS